MTRLLLLIVNLLLAFSCSCFAAVIERDWRAPGDGLLTYDTVNQREWLDLSQTLRINFPPNYLVEDVALELEPGGMFEGFTWANIEDVTEFAQSAGIDTSTLDVAVNGDAVSSLLDLIGRTSGFLSPGSRGVSVGFLSDTITSPDGVSWHPFAFFNDRLSGSEAGLLTSLTASEFRRASTSGLMLYRNVPEPNASQLASVGLIFLSTILAMRKKVDAAGRPTS
ncbi:hypothetical protein NG895_04795 [Aeoliella sp. ICT_H6.2]|uniref:PEP-CTERM protein-sorting domain-containing protein n=1 Tax=Aeoliella straminimaris TaxID=2954799 RepID=A0A9X2F6N2_9BACT|nr:hypothetical protein [Aeoliella straminimaris]MCO6043215.1 hypothetical protein [Aeoliella straminimaris]